MTDDLAALLPDLARLGEPIEVGVELPEDPDVRFCEGCHDWVSVQEIAIEGSPSTITAVMDVVDTESGLSMHVCSGKQEVDR